MIKCPECGVENPDGSQFCHGCGKTLISPSGPAGVPNPEDRPIERTMVMQVPLGMINAQRAAGNPPTQQTRPNDDLADLPNVGAAPAAPNVGASGTTGPIRPPVGATGVEAKTPGGVWVSLILGILSVFGCYVLFFIPPLAAIIIGFRTRGQIKASNGALKGGGLALVGVILGALGLVFGIVALAVYVPTILAIVSSGGTAP